MKPVLDCMAIDVQGPVARLSFSRPHRANALDWTGWEDLGRAARWLAEDESIRVAVLAGEGRHFCAGLDPSLLDRLRPGPEEASAAAAHRLKRQIAELQETVTALEECPKPIIAAVHGACIGGGLDIAVACDIRLCAEDAQFCLKEVDLAIVADMGVLQRLPHLIGEGRTRELALTARTVDAVEAERIGLVTGLYPDREQLESAALDLACALAEKPHVALEATKAVMTRRLRADTSEGLDHVATLNAGIMFSPELERAVAAMPSRKDR